MRLFFVWFFGTIRYTTTLPTLGSPVESSLEKRNVTCTANSGALYDPSCWDQLDIPGYLQNWNSTVPRCGPGDDGSTCCNPTMTPNEPWSTCFLRLALNESGHDCSQINVKGCDMETFHLRDGIPDAAQARYTVRSIYAVNSAMVNWYTALQYATTQASLEITKIIHLVDPPQELHVTLDLVLAALMTGLTLIAAPEIGLAETVVEKSVVGTLVAGAIDTPFMARALVPTVNQDSRLVQIGDLSSQVKNMTSEISNQINAGLHVVMSNLNSFTSFAAHGRFAGPNATSIPQETNMLTIGLTTWVLTFALQNNEYEVYYGPNMTDGLVPTPDSAASNFGCTIEPGGFCDIPTKKKGRLKQPTGWATWGSQDMQQFYTISKFFPQKGKFASGSDILSAAVANNWTTMPLLFDASYNCTQSAVAPNSRNTGGISWDADGKPDFSCISQLDVNPGCGNFPGRVTSWATAQKTGDCTPFLGVF